MTPPARPGSTARTRVRRLPDKAVTDRAALAAVLDAARVAHVAVVDPDGQPYVVPVAYARDGDRVVFHGSTGSRLFRSLAAGAPTCLTVTVLESLVVARSVFECSMGYRSAMVLGTATVLDGAAKLSALRVLSEHLLPGRWDEARGPNAKELAATMVLALPLAEASVKVGAGGPHDDPGDLAHPVYGALWAGEVPVVTTLGAPVPDAQAAAGGAAVPGYVAGWRA